MPTYIKNDNFEMTALHLLDGVLDIIAYWPKDHIMMVFGKSLGTQLYEAMTRRKPESHTVPSWVVQT